MIGKKFKKIILIFAVILLILGLGFALFTIFFDQAVLVRRGTVYRTDTSEKLVALTFDDGPSPLWTPRVLIELKRAGVKATFFMLGEHVEKYPEVARQVAQEGHEIGNHTFYHHVLLYYKAGELEKEIRDTEQIIKKVTGVTTRYFRPPKAWLTNAEKKKIKEMGYEVVLWSLNSKDWVTFHQKSIRNYILLHVRPGDIILFHDSGGVFSIEGGSRKETVVTIYRLVEQLKERGYKLVTVSELLKHQKGKINE